MPSTPNDPATPSPAAAPHQPVRRRRSRAPATQTTVVNPVHTSTTHQHPRTGPPATAPAPHAPLRAPAEAPAEAKNGGPAKAPAAPAPVGTTATPKTKAKVKKAAAAGQPATPNPTPATNPKPAPEPVPPPSRTPSPTSSPKNRKPAKNKARTKKGKTPRVAGTGPSLPPGNTDQPPGSTGAGDEEVVSIPDIEPFQIDPIIFGRLNALGADGLTVLRLAVLTTAGTLTALVMVTAVANTFRATSSGVSPGALADAMLTRSEVSMTAVPLLADYPSLLLLLTIVGSFLLVYHLFRAASTLHSDLASTECVVYTSTSPGTSPGASPGASTEAAPQATTDQAPRPTLRSAVEEMNNKFEAAGQRAVPALVLCFAVSVSVAYAMRDSLFVFLGNDDLSRHWWASVSPFNAGSIIWITVGAVGLYTVYVEAVLGIVYVKFARRCGADFRFRANPANPDGAYGWRSLRTIVNNLQLGVVLTALSSWAMSYFLAPAVGWPVTVSVITAFVAIVIYVFYSVNAHWRRQVTADKSAQIMALHKQLSTPTAPDKDWATVQNTIWDEIDRIQAIPNSPLRRKWLIAGALAILAPLTAIAAHVLKATNN